MNYTISIFLTALFAFSEASTSGIFIIKKPTKKNPCEQELKMLIGGKNVCVLKKPILSIGALEYVTDILYDPKNKSNYVDLGLSSTSVNTLNQTISILPKTQFALVVDSKVVCIFTIHEKMDTRYIRIGKDLDQKNLAVVHDILIQAQD